MSSRAHAIGCVTLATAVVLCAPITASPQAPTFTIAFMTDRNMQETATDLWLVDSNGENERPLTQAPTPEASPSWSPDGTTIVYACAPDADSANPSWEVCTIDLATKQVTRLTTTPEDEFDPRYTADGKQIVLETYLKGSGNADIAITPARGGVPKRLTLTPNVDEQDPAPDPNDSNRIAFALEGTIAILDIDAPKNVEFVRPDSPGLTSDSPGDTDPSFSSRDTIAFASPKGASYDITVAYQAKSVGRQRRLNRLTQGPQTDIEPAWTSDATAIVFARALRPRSRRYRIFRVDAGGRDEQAVSKGGTYADTAPAPQPVGAARLPGRTSRSIAAQAAKSPVQAAKSLQFARAANACKGNPVYGSNGRDNPLRGTRYPDCVYARAGNDVIYTLLGRHDNVDGGTGVDYCHIDPPPTDKCIHATH